MWIALYLEVEMDVAIVRIGDSGPPDRAETRATLYDRSHSDVRIDLTEMRVECHISIHRFEPDLIATENVEVAELVVLGELISSLESVKIFPFPIRNDADDDSLPECTHARPVWGHDIPSMMNAIGRIPTVRTSCPRDELFLEWYLVSGDGRYVSASRTLVEDHAREIAP